MRRKVSVLFIVLCIILLAACSFMPQNTLSGIELQSSTDTADRESENTVFDNTSFPESFTAEQTEVITERSTVATATSHSTEATTKKKVENATVATTKAYEYDMSNPAVKTVMAMVGEKHLCSEVAEAAVNQAGLTGWKSYTEGNMTYHILEPEGFLDLGTKVSKSEIRPGDILYYADGGRGVSHVAVYVGNSQAVHGNWTTDGTTALARAFYREPTYIIHIDYSK